MYAIRKGRAPSASGEEAPNSYSYLSCASNRNGICKAKPIRIEATELVYREILAKVADNSLSDGKGAALASRLEAAQGKLLIEQGKQTVMAEGLATVPSQPLMKALHKLEGAIDQLKEEIANIKLSLASDTIDDKAAFFAKLDLSDRDVRQKSNELLKRLNIIVKIDGAASRYTVEQDQIRTLDIIDDKDRGVTFYPATWQLQGKVRAQEGKWLPGIVDEDDYVEGE